MKRAMLPLLLALSVLVLSHAPALSAVFKITINGTPVPQPTRAVVREGQLMMPLRSLPDLLGFTFTWDQATHTAVATRGETVVRMTIDSKTGQLNQEALELAVAPALIKDTTYVPVEFLAKAFGGQVEWEAADTGAVNVTVNGERYPLDFATIIRNDCVMAPVARVCDKLFKAKVLVHEPAKAVFVNSEKVTLTATVGNLKAYANGKPVTLAAPPELVEDIFYAPLKFLVEAFGGSVQWDAATHTFDIRAQVAAASPAETAPSD